MTNRELIEYIEKDLSTCRSKKIRFYAPSFMQYNTNYFHSSPETFPSISVTGSNCALECKHCSGKVLNTMLPAITPKKLFNICSQLKHGGAAGCLISGGCLLNGSVPLGKFVNAIARIKQDLGITVVVHTGVIDYTTARRLKDAGVDSALIDVIGSNETIREIYHLNVTVDDYDQALSALNNSGIPFVPHILIGLHHGKIKGEIQALKMISKYKPSAITLIALIPIRNTPMEKVQPPSPEDIARILMSSRLILPKIPLVLGCMRPKREHRLKTDRLAVMIGVDAIAFPTEDAIQLSESMGLEINFSSLCCSQIFDDIELSI